MSVKKSNQGGPSLRSADVFNSIRAEDARSLVIMMLLELQRNSEVVVLFDIKA